MKKFLFACLLALPVVALSDAPAWAWGCGLKLCIGFNVSCSGWCSGCCNSGCGTGCGYGCATGCDYGAGYGSGGCGYDGVCYGNTGYSGYDAGTAYAAGAMMAAPAQMAGYQQPNAYPTYGFTPVGYNYQAPTSWYGR